MAPERRKVLAVVPPLWLTLPEPLMTPLRVTRPVPLLVPVNVSVLLPSENAFEIVKAPVFCWLIEVLPLSVNALPAIVSVAVEVLVRVTAPNWYEVMSFVDV